ncbi:hypothetical protein K4F52_006145 [Lecanicillium sp. MT-2017a]|nr:hypothetical protein K4F52_006145 [Lecanicillium sp. MT-2017a]
MPLHRIPRLPKAKTSEVLCIGAAGVGVLAPLYMIMPGAEEKLAKQTTKWAPRWERNISYFVPSAERTAQRIEPPVSRVVQSIDERLPLEKMAKRVDKSIRAGVERFQPKGPSGPSS